MKVIGLVASARRVGNSHEFASLVLKELERMGVDTSLIHLADYDVNPCARCSYECLNDKTCPVKDDALRVYERLAEADGILVATPTYSGDVPAMLKALIERGNAVEADLWRRWKLKAIAIIIIGSFANLHSLSTVVAGFSRGYNSVGVPIAATMIVPTRNYNYPDAWKLGGLVKDEENRRNALKFAERVYEVLKGLKA